MTFRVLPLLLLVAPLALAPGAEERPLATPQPGVFHRLLHPFGEKKQKSGPSDTKGRLKQLDLAMTVEPKAIKLSENRVVKVTVTLTNKGKEIAQLEFPSTQRIEVIVKTKGGKLVEQWSEDQAFTNEPSLVAINPGERLEYAANLSTRDLTAGEPYVIEAFFPNYEALRKEHTITPEK